MLSAHLPRGGLSHLMQLLPCGFAPRKRRFPAHPPRSVSDELRLARYFFFFAAFFLALFLAMMNSFGLGLGIQG
jgi:hypothetical protein